MPNGTIANFVKRNRQARGSVTNEAIDSANNSITKGGVMKFVQIMEQTGDVEEARAEIEGYFSSADTETKVKKLMLCTDRDVPGKMVTIVEFESWDTATDNNELDATQEGAAEAQATTDITYQNLDVHHEWVR
ncbi:MAG TPA: hypothetical protein DHW19_00045 [Acidimicrobiaceae bacterium]|nr:hypothetical protein [Acidimicrobiaceae bacterium]